MAWRNRLAQARVVAADDPSLLFSSGENNNNNNAIIQSSMRDRLDESTARPGSSHPDAAYSFDQVLKKLETTRQRHNNKGVQSSSPTSSMNARRHTPRTPSGRQVTVLNDSYDDDDSSSDDSRNDRFFASDVNDEYLPDNGSIGSSSNEQQQQQQRLIETRQQFVDRQVDYSTHHHGSSSHHNTVVDSFIEKQQSTEEWRMESSSEVIPDTSNLPSAILKLDQRLSIPAPMHKKDVLVEIEVR
jgi:hypothetical protein